MSTIAVSMVRDEADVIEDAIALMLRQVDWVIVADNGSTDGTREILETFADRGKRITVVSDTEVGYFQSRKMTALAAQAADMGARWVIPFDADEVWVSRHGRIADVLAGVKEPVAAAPIINHVATARDSPHRPVVEAMAYRRREVLGLPKVACQPRIGVTIEQGNHGAHYPSGVATGLLEVRHFPYRSADQFVRKAVNGAQAYAATDLPHSTGQHWREYGQMIAEHGEQAGRDWFLKHFFVEQPELDPDLVHDPVPLLT